MIKFDVFNRFTGVVQFTAEIDCAEDTPRAIKLGLAVKWGEKKGANLSGADLSGADLSGANLSGANLSGADLYRADLSGANLSGANLSGADLSGADLSGANLSGANLHGADLHGADLHGADLHGADLRDADLHGANLRGANLYGANLHGANLHGAKIKRIIASANRLDGYTFYAFETEAHGVMIKAGCRWLSIPDFRAHVARKYPGTPKAVETTDILDFIEKRAASAAEGNPT